jgi:hypothetical protein
MARAADKTGSPDRDGTSAGNYGVSVVAVLRDLLARSSTGAASSAISRTPGGILELNIRFKQEKSIHNRRR